jgi:hypothetical protein
VRFVLFAVHHFQATRKGPSAGWEPQCFGNLAGRRVGKAQVSHRTHCRIDMSPGRGERAPSAENHKGIQFHRLLALKRGNDGTPTAPGCLGSRDLRYGRRIKVLLEHFSRVVVVLLCRVREAVVKPARVVAPRRVRVKASNRVEKRAD